MKLEAGEQREDNLTKALALSFGDLDEADQGRFRALGVLAFDAPFDRLVLAAIWETRPEMVDDLADRLRLLSLIQADGGLYRQHPLLRAYALALLKREGIQEAVFERYAEAMIGVAERFEKLQPEAWGELTVYLPHIQAIGPRLAAQMAVRSTQAAETDNALLRRAQAFALNTRRYLFLRPEVRQMDWLEMGLVASRHLKDTGNEAIFLHALGRAYHALEEKRRALDYYAQALPAFRAVGDRGGEAGTLNNIGLIYADLGEKREALDFYEQALPLCRAVGDRGREAGTLNNMGNIYYGLREKRKALDYYEQALPLCRAVGDRGREAVACFNIGGIYHSLGDLDQAIRYVERCIELKEQTDHLDLDSRQWLLEQLKRERDGDTQQPLPTEIVEDLCNTTVAVKTTLPQHLEDLRPALQGMRDEVGWDRLTAQLWLMAFIAALLAVLDDQPASLPNGNPYQPHLQHVLSEIEAYQKGKQP